MSRCTRENGAREEVQLQGGARTGAERTRVREHRKRSGNAADAPRSRSEHGFTLVEVMIALAILAINITILLSVLSRNIADTQKAQMLTVVTNLARGKMYDIEEDLVREGFQEQDEELEGDFDEEGWRDVKWKAEVLKVEVPSLNVAEEAGEEASEGAADTAEALGGAGAASMLDNASGGLLGSTGIGAGQLAAGFDMIGEALKSTMRKVVLTVEWEAAGETQSMVLDYYVTKPSALGGMLGAVAGQPPQTGGTGTGGTGTGGTGTGGTGGKVNDRRGGGGGTR